MSRAVKSKRINMAHECADPLYEGEVELSIMSRNTEVEIRTFSNPEESTLGTHINTHLLDADEAIELATQLLEKARIAKYYEQKQK